MTNYNYFNSSISIEVFSHFNNVVILLDSFNEIAPCVHVLKDFLEIRGLNIMSSVTSFISEGFNFLSWNVLKRKFFCPSIIVNEKNIKEYKCKLKAIVKSSYNKNIALVIDLLNYEIQTWISLYIFSSNWKDLAVELDIYIYKVLWRYVRRCHSRRTNSWIYSKYWKRFSGIWKFFAVDSVQNKTLFLKSHLFLLNNNCKNNCKIPSSLNAFNLYNFRKIFDCLSEKDNLYFSYAFNLLYKKQKGLCPVCRKPLWLKYCKIVKYILNSHKNSDLLQDFFLIHTYCKHY